MTSAGSTPSPGASGTWHTRVVSWLGKGWWAGIAGILTAVGIGLALFASCNGPEPVKPSPPGNQINGNCNAQGSGNSVSCS
jgi:hypothetical protein